MQPNTLERMTHAAFDPLQLSVEAFAKNEQSLEGEWPLRSLPRLLESTHSPQAADVDIAVSWQLRGESRAARAGPPEIWLHLESSASVALTCQRCLQAMTTQVSAQRSFRFVHGEAAAAELDAQSEEDVLALSRHLDARDLIEDELLLELPLVPRHDICPQPLLERDMSVDDSVKTVRENPFAALAQLKSNKLSG